jgi:small-conductance mechanosensitive channel
VHNNIRVITAFFLLTICLPVTANSQQNEDGGLSEKQPVPQTAPVVVDGLVLFRVRGVSAMPAESRASVIAERITAAAADGAFPVDKLSVEELETCTSITAGNRQIAAIYDADAVLEGKGVSRQILAQVYLKKITQAIQSYRHDRSRAVLLSNAGYSLGALVALVVLLWSIFRVFRWLSSRIEARYKSKLQGVRIQSLQLVQAEQIWFAVRGILRMMRTLLLLVISLTYAEYVLSLFPWTRYFAKRTLVLILDPLSSMGNSFVAAVPNLLFIAILILVVHYILKLSRLFFASIENATVSIAGFNPEWAWPTFKLLRLAAIVFAAVIAYPYMPGSSSDAFKGISIFVGVLISIGSSSFVANIIAGYGLIYRRAFKIGDRVQIGDHFGDVHEIRLQVTHLRTIKNEEVIVPNSKILTSEVVNYSTLAKTQGLILHTTVGIGYETPWRQVESMLLMAAGRTEGLLRQPSPFVRQKLLGDFCITYEINVYCSDPQASNQLYTELHRNILDVFNEYGVQIMTPAYERDPADAKVVPREKWFEAPALPPDQNR